MSSPNYGLKVAEDFQEYLKTGDENLIQQYSVKELKVAISRLSPYYDNNKLWYRTLEQRIEELSSIEQRKKRSHNRWKEVLKEKWLDKIVSFLLGVLGGLALQTF